MFDFKSFLGGTLLGSTSVGFTFLKLFQTKMVKEIVSPKSFEETCSAIEKVVPEFADEGWGFPFGKWDFYKVFESRNIEVKDINKIMVYFLCNAKLAAQVINVNPAMMGIMPCSWAVNEKTDGKVYIAKINIGLMSKMFTGTIREMMLEVEETEKRMFERIFA
ncbi:DUF302 domain-containing protein [Hippea maritima]|uniref:DUF302 domain-containing protein n=1 Tax=Hippea maritima (strain ATCC 700847 / DSM 10411 / MH2) TaxID=760142 RepID=F2LV13_HIPMA|nr:DUF302 domain-containing protein [Hippea maritima]AEA33597.1 protein of unknown function DUF302 [Hippea maritima DSM 10411]